MIIISVQQGDITKLRVDAVVNAANSSLLGGGDVDAPYIARQVPNCSTNAGYWEVARQARRAYQWL